jgi:hypothetical protein
LDVTASGDATLSITSAGVQRYQLIARSSGNFEIYDQSSAASRVTLSQSGNLGLGVTPSAWGSFGGKALDINGGAAILGSINQALLSSNAYFNAGWIYKESSFANYYIMNSGGQHQWHTAPSGTAGDAISFSQAMTLDASGNLGVGITAPTQNGGGGSKVLHVNSTGASDWATLHLTNGTTGSTGSDGFVIGLFSDGNAQLFNYENTAMVFSTNATERARIDSSGNFLIGGTPSSVKFYVEQSANNLNGYFRSTNASFSNGVLEAACDRNTTDSSYNFIQCAVTGVAYRFFVRDSGNVQNTNNSYGAISDAKLKENVTDATPKLEKLQQVRVVNYNLIGEAQKQIGVIAQELEQVFPGMVEEAIDRDTEGNDLGTTTKSVKYSVFVPMLIKAIQEQQAIITALTARVAALESI